MWGVVDVSVWTNPCLSVPNIVLSRENPLAAGYSKPDLPPLHPLYCIIWKAVARRVHYAVRVEPNGHEWCMGCRKRHLEFTVNLLSCIQGKTTHCCGLFSKAASIQGACFNILWNRSMLLKLGGPRKKLHRNCVLKIYILIGRNFPIPSETQKVTHTAVLR